MDIGRRWSERGGEREERILTARTNVQ